MNEEIRVSRDMFDTTLAPSEARLIGDFFGNKGLKTFFSILRGETINPRVEKRLDKAFYGNLSNIFDIPITSAENFFLKQLGSANDVINHLLDIFSLPVSEFGLRNEISLLSEHPTQRLHYLSGEVDPVLNFETARQLVIALTSGVLNRSHEQDKVHTTLSDLSSFIAPRLYQGRVGSTRTIGVFSVHDNLRNELKYWSQSPEMNVPNKHHLKATNFRVRITKNNIPVLTHSRKKNDKNTILKALVKSLHNPGNTILLDKDVEDKMGLMFVVFGGEEERNTFIVNLNGLMTDYAKLKGYPFSFKDDPLSDKGRGQSTKVQFKREKILLGSKTPTEIIVFTPEEYLNYIYDIGTWQPDNGHYDGVAHSLFELRRNADALHLLFPPQFYSIDIDSYVKETMKKKAIDLRHLNRTGTFEDDY